MESEMSAEMMDVFRKYCESRGCAPSSTLAADYWHTWQAALQSRQQLSDAWQLIETAPRDGTKFDVWCSVESCRFTDVYWYDRHGSFAKDHGYPVSTTIFYHEPTHWQPLPAPHKPPQQRRGCGDALYFSSLLHGQFWMVSCNARDI